MERPPRAAGRERRHLGVADADGPGRRRAEARDGTPRRRLARARLPDERVRRPPRDRERHVVDGDEGRASRAAELLGEVSDVDERGRGCGRRRRGALDDAREGGGIREEGPRVGRRRCGQHLSGPARLLHGAAAHDDDPVGAVGGDGEVVRDEEDAGARLRAELVEQIEHRPLHRDIERASRFVGDDQLGLERERRRDQHALAHAAGQLVRVLARTSFGVVDTDAVEQVDDARADLRGILPPVDAEGFADAPADRRDRVEGVARVLRDEGDAAPAQVPPAAFGKADEVGETVGALGQPDAPRGHGAVRSQQADDGLRDGRLARSGLADERGDRPRLDVERDTADGIDGASLRAVLHGEIADGQQRLRAHATSPPRSA